MKPVDQDMSKTSQRSPKRPAKWFSDLMELDQQGASYRVRGEMMERFKAMCAAYVLNPRPRSFFSTRRSSDTVPRIS